MCSVKDIRFDRRLSTPEEIGIYYKPLSNGILRFEVRNHSVGTTFLSFDSDIFNTHHSKYTYQKSAGCPIFMKFLNEIHDPDEIKLLQEIAGLLLIPINPTQRFFVFLGDGANGKTTFAEIIRLVLGEENVSDVPLKDFLPNSKFGLILTENKLLNIAEELDDYGNLVSSVLKNYVTQGKILVQEKHKDLYLMRPTARLLFSTNVIPGFRDESSGLIRRMMIIPFSKQFLNSQEQNKNYIDADFWIKSGELSGILNWAIRGLKRLSQNNWTFSETEKVRSMMEQYKKTTSPSIQFLRDYLEVNPNGHVINRDLYNIYSKHCRLYNLFAENDIAFGRLVSKTFHQARLSKGTRLAKDQVRSRYWKGIQLRQDDNFLTEQNAQIAQAVEPFCAEVIDGGHNE